MNKDVKLSISVTDICIVYGCMAFLMYAVSGASYYIGKTRAKIEIANKIQEIVSESLPPRK